MQPFSPNALTVFIDVYDKALAEMGLPTLTTDQRAALLGMLNLLAQGSSKGNNPLLDVLAIIESHQPDKVKQLQRLLKVREASETRQ